MLIKNFLPATVLLLTGCPIVTDAEHAERIDVDGDGLISADYPGGTDCDDRDGAVGTGELWYADADGDGFGVGEGTRSCTPIEGRSNVAGDCDDAASGIRPGGDELCNGLDDDCDGVRDNGFEVFAAFYDGDSDGVGTDIDAIAVCALPEGYVQTGGDCDDSSALVTPGRAELCNGIDDNCDGVRDEGLAQQVFYADTDGDGYGDMSVTETLCAPSEGWVADATDCDDGSASTFPGATEVCNGLDDDCDGVPDDGLTPLRPFYPDVDGDGYGDDALGVDLCAAPPGWVDVPGDCDDTAEAISPDAVEDCAVDGDEDCNPRTSCGPRGNMLGLGISWFAPESADWKTGAALAVVRDGALTRVAVGAPNYDMDASAATGLDGAMYIVTAPRTPQRIELSDGAFVESGRWSFGHAITDVADMDGDGVRDFAVGAPYTYSYTGRAYVVSSRTGDAIVPEVDDPLLSITPDDDWYGIGYSLDAGADLTGDGIEDLVVGAPWSGNSGNAYRGYVGILSTSATGSMNISDATSYIQGDAGDQIGTSVAVLTDFNGDGFADLAVGTPLEDSSGTDSGAVALFLGPLADGRTRWRDADAYYFGISAGDHLGASIADAGDVNGDGFSDLVIGAPGHSQSGVNGRGGVYIIFGRANPTSYTVASADGVLLGEGNLFHMGDAVAAAGDVDGNGLDDLLMGQPRAIDNRGRGILQMAPFTPTVRTSPDGYVPSTHPNHEAGYSLAGSGDVNDDGYDDILIGMTGSTPLYLADGSVILVYGQP